MSKENYSERFFKIICNYNPYFSSAMDKDVPILPDYSRENVMNTIDKMNKLIEDMEKECDNNKYLKQSIITTKFFLKNSILWNNPYYYYYRLESSLEICWNCHSVINGKPAKVDVIKKRLENLERYINTAIKNMEYVDIGKLDCIYGISKFKDLKLFEFIKKKFEININLEKIKKQMERICEFLEKKKKESINILCPYDSKTLEKYIFLETGLVFSKENLEKSLYESLNINVPEGKVGVKIEGENVQSILAEIINAGKNIFGQYEKLEDSINYIYISREENRYLNYIGYVPNPISEKKVFGTFMYNERFLKKDKYDKILGIVHEIYPGHHYMNCINKTKNLENISKVLYESTAFSEGWAKYCEYIYASKILEDEKFYFHFGQQLERVSLIGITAYKIYFQEKDYNSVYEELYSYENGKYREAANSIILQAYISPVESISIVLGFMFFYKNQRNLSLEQIYNEGAWILRDMCV